jgi:hypothetical protein
MKFSIHTLILLGGIYGIHEIFIVGTQRYFSKIVGNAIHHFINRGICFMYNVFKTKQVDNSILFRIILRLFASNK